MRVAASTNEEVPVTVGVSSRLYWKGTVPRNCLGGPPGQRRIPDAARRAPLVIEAEPQDTAALAARVRGHRGDILFHKHRFDAFSNPNVLPVLDVLNPHDIVLYRVALDVCDKYAIEGLLQHPPQPPAFPLLHPLNPT